MRGMMVREVISMRGIIREVIVMGGILRKGNLKGKFPRIKEIGSLKEKGKEKEIEKKAKTEMAQMVDLLDQDIGGLSHRQITIATAVGTILDRLLLLLALERVMRMKNPEELDTAAMMLLIH